VEPGFRLFPEAASTLAPGVDHLYFFLVAVSGAMLALIFACLLFFAIRYRRRSEDERATQIHGSVGLEIFWSAVPLVIFMAMFYWGADLYFQHASPPANAAEIYIVGKQWMWKLQHPEGPREINELHVPIGRPVKLIMTSEDVVHSFFIPAFRIKQDVLPGRYTVEWFQATKPGRYHIFCAEYCGTNHSHMTGWLEAMEPAAYQQWLGGGGGAESMVSSGEKLFHDLGCSTCHARDCPPLQGLYGREVPLEGGGTVVADDAYLRESILDPQAKIVRGYQPLMPTFKGQVTEEGLLQLLAYLKSLSGEPVGSLPAAGSPNGGKPK
jgi:cytochrome c oxidase subunit II